MLGLRERISSAVFSRVAGPEGPKRRERIHDSVGPRWFEPDSAIVRVHSDASMFVGGIRALLMQTMHPAAMRAVSEHSGYRGDMWGRLQRTSHYLAATTFGTAQDAESMIAMVRSIHERVHGVMPDGTPYSASDPHLLSWVHVAEVDSFLRAHDVYGKQPLVGAERDQYVAESGLVAAKLGVLDPPTTVAELERQLADFRPELRGTPEAREAVSYLLFKPPLPLAARAPYAVLVAAGVALMPRWTRLPLRLPWLPVSERTVVRVLGGAAIGTIRWAMTPPADLPKTG